MKLLKRVSILAVLITVIAVFAGCGKEATVVGTWEGDDYTYTFNDDGTGIQQIGEISVSITSYEANPHTGGRRKNMDDPILEKRLKNMFESRAGELPDESVREARIRRNVYEKIEREGNYMKKGFMKKAVAAVAAICVFGSMTAFAIGKIAGITSRKYIRYAKVHTDSVLNHQIV